MNVGDVSVDFHKIMQRMRALRAGISPTDSCARFQKQLGIDVFQVLLCLISLCAQLVSAQALLQSAFCRALRASSSCSGSCNPFQRQFCVSPVSLQLQLQSCSGG